MAEGTVRVAEAVSGGKLVRTQELSVSAQTVEQEVSSLADAAGNLVSSTLPGVAGKTSLDVNLLATASGVAPVTGSLASTGATVQVATASAGNVTVSVKGTYAASLAFEASDDGGTTWYPVQASRSDGSAVDVTTPVLTSVAGMWEIVAPGFTHVRVRCAAWTSGTATVRLTAGPFLYDPSPTVQVAGQSWGAQGRTLFSAYLVGASAAANTETIANLTPSRAGVTGAAASSLPVTTGKTLRLQAMTLTAYASAAALFAMRVVLRAAPATVTAATAPVTVLAVNNPTAAINSGGTEVVTFPDGLEFPSGWQIGVSYNATATGVNLDVALVGYEY